MQRNITIDHVTYEVERIYSGKQSVSSLIQDRLQRDLAHSTLLTSDAHFRYNGQDEAVRQKEAT